MLTLPLAVRNESHMASRYMNYLRKNAKVILVFLGIVCMITFVVGTALLDLVNSRGNSQAAQNPVVVTWTKGKVHEQELHQMRFHHQAALRFLMEVIALTTERGGRPMINGRPLTPQQVGELIPEDSSDESLVQTMVLAEEARRLGVVVDQEAVKSFLRQLSSPELGEKDWLDIADGVLNQQAMTVTELNEQLAYELRARHVRMLARAGLFSHGMMPIVPPGEAWEMFNRLNRRVAIEAYPVEVQ